MDDAGFEQVLRRAQQADAGALETLVDAYRSRIYGLLYRLTGSRDVAEDLLQATFLRVVRMLPTYEHSGKFESWLFRIAANLVRDRARKLQRHRRAFASDPTVVPGSEFGPRGVSAQVSGPEEDIIRRESDERLQASLQKLSDSEREILLLRHYSDLSFREIADILNVPLGTALSRAHRALARLKQDLGDET